ncbi:hypothetical protein [Acidobacterium sp. S8]|uniref:hypothetical protein n=1 Tax=Acidobacterium sp. S8 TaxID=1641854 RepID=UPI00131C65D7|nr:hypothetical protein [Acidobacterium sp. S8]
MRTALASILLLLAAAPAYPQNSSTDESRLHRDFRVEKEALGACTKFDFGSLTDCGQTLVMGQPMHITVGSLAPQNGIAAGLAFVEHKNFANEWRVNWDIDAQASSNGSWRAGGYMKAYRLPGGMTYRVAPLFNFYSQSISLNRVDYYGLGPYSVPQNHTTYGFSENITGADAAIPLAGAARIAIVAELNGRFPSVRPGTDSSLPSIGQFFDETNTPGLAHQAAYLQASEGLRLSPALFKDHLRLNYLVQFHQFVAPGNSTYSFRRFNGDFSHEIPLYSLLPGKFGKAYYPNRSAQFSHNGPDDCTGSSGGQNIARPRAAAADARPNAARPCPIISTTDKLEGSITLRALFSESFANRGSFVPFYFSPTIGGSDINGTAMLPSYPDYRFRGPDLLLFRGTIEHSIGKLPIGAIFSVDEEKIGLRRDDVSIDHLRHSFSAGITIRAGGLPAVYLLFGWGGNEGSHTTATISPTLLGGSSRPSLF